jgi:outer membrane protein assembly complex protein YaeT
MRVAARTIVLAGLALFLSAASATADVRDYLGRLIVDVRVEVAGAPYTEPSVLQLIETRVGEALSMERVRESIDHLVGIGRFEDVRVFAARSVARTDGVVLNWVLVPVQRISHIDIDGRAVFSDDTLRAEISERVGSMPVTSRVGDIEEAVRAYYAERGYRSPSISSSIEPGRTPELVTLEIAIDPGRRTTIGDVTVQGPPDLGAAVIERLGLKRGSPYDGPGIASRADEYEASLRDLGYYQANLDITTTFNDAQSAVDLVLDIDRGPRVRVVFAGDPLPENRRDALVPIRQERSVDLDLLEDASRNIEAFLRQQGYRAAEAPYVREEQGEEMVLTFTVTRGALHRLASLDVAGQQQLTRADIAPLLALQPGEAYSETRVATVASAVTELYRVRGFARASVKPEVTVLDAVREAGQLVRPVGVRLLVNEGVRTSVGDVDLAGTDVVAASALRPLLLLTSGRPFYRPQLDADREALERHYRNEGFRNVRAVAETTLDASGERLDVRWAITEGPRTTVDRVLVTGNVRTSDDLIRREIPLQAGSPLGDDALIESQRRLAALGLFRRVRILELPHTGSTARDLLIEVEEAPTTTIDYGGGLEAGRRARATAGDRVEDRIDIAPRAFFQISRRNLWGKNRSVTLFTRVSLRPRDPGTESDPADTGGYGFNEYRAVGTFREPRVFNRAGDLQLTGFLEQAIRTSFNFSRRGVRLDYARRFAASVTVTGRYAFDRTRLFDIHIDPEEQLLVDRLFPQVRLSTVTGALLRDTRNDVIDPERGTLSGMESTFALRSIGSEVGFAKLSLQGFVYRRLPGSRAFTIAAGARLGASVGFARVLEDGTIVDDVPASERFFAGGDSTVRGFVLDRLGTADTLNRDGFPAGGSGLVVTNIELRTPYWKGLGGVGFFDAGNVFARAGDIRFSELRPAAGFGVRYRSPLGPLRFDLGFNLDRQTLPNGVRERGTVFHLSLGQAF